MKAKGKCWKRCLAVMLTLILCIGFMPEEAFAFVGPIVDLNPPVEITECIEQDGWEIARIQNDYLTFEIKIGEDLICRTVPTKTAGNMTLKESYEQNIYQEIQFNDHLYYGWSWWPDENGDDKLYEDSRTTRLILDPGSVKVYSNRNPEPDDYLSWYGDGWYDYGDFLCLKFNLKIKDPDPRWPKEQYAETECWAVFYLVESNEGIFRDAFSAPVTPESYEEEHGVQERGKTYIVQAKFGFRKHPRSMLHKRDGIYVSMKNHRMPYYGHENETNPEKMLAEYGNYAGDSSEQVVRYGYLADISGGIEETSTETSWGKDNYSAAGTLTYDEANPFVILGHNYYDTNQNSDYGIHSPWGTLEWFRGMNDEFAVSMAYTPPSEDEPPERSDVFTVKTREKIFDADAMNDHDGRYGSTYCYVILSEKLSWGMRNLFAADEPVIPLGEGAAAIKSEFSLETFTKGTIQVRPARSGETSATGLIAEHLDKDKKEDDDAIAVLRGAFHTDSDGGYIFDQGIVSLSPTVTAKYDPTLGHFRISKYGTIDAEGIRLDVPTFCMYKSKNKSNGKEPEFSIDEEKGLVITMDPSNNSALISANIAFAKTEITGASLDRDGNVRFSGGLRISTVIDKAKFEITEFQMGPDGNGGFSSKGIKAHIDVNKAQIFSFNAKKVKGDINTIDDKYKFDIDLDAKDLFQFAAQLDLVKTKDHVLMPNTLTARFANEVIGVTIIPEIPVFEIKGTSLGFSNLVDTINGDYIIVPPFNVTIGGYGTFAKTISGWLEATLGPSVFKVTGSQLKIAGYEMIKKLEAELHDSGKVITGDDGNDYTGINVGGSLTLGMDLLNGLTDSSDGADLSHILQLEGAIGFDAFAGKWESPSVNKDDQLLLMLTGTGRVVGTLQFPDWAELAKVKLNGTQIRLGSILMQVGGQTTMPCTDTTVIDAFEEALRNLKCYFAVCGQVDIPAIHARVYYVTPTDYGFEFSFLKELDEFKIEDHLKRGVTEGKAVAIVNEEGEQAGYAVFDAGLDELDIFVISEADAADALPKDGDEFFAEPKEENNSEPEEEIFTAEEAETETIEPMAADVSNVLYITLGEDAQMNPDDAVLLDVTVPDMPSRDEFLNGLFIDGEPGVEIEVNGNEGNEYTGNVLIEYEGESDRVVSAFLYLDSSKQSWTITSDIPLSTDVSLFTSNDKFEELTGVQFTGNSISGMAENLKKSERYELQIFMGKEPENGTVPVGEPIEITGLDAKDFFVDVPNEGAAADEGEYYISAVLSKVETVDLSGDGEEQTVRIPISRWESEAPISYKNINTPDAPAEVRSEATGNETLTCSFSEVENADGYKIRIYKDGEDTGYGYEFTKKEETDPETGELIKTLEGADCSDAITFDGGMYSIRLAPTVGVTQEGAGENGSPELLQPGSGYSLGVSTFRYIDQEEKKYPVYSQEVLTGEATIEEYRPAEIAIKVNGKEAVLNDDGIYEATVTPDKRELEVLASSSGTCRIEVSAEEAEEGTLLTATGSLKEDLPAFDGKILYHIVVTDMGTQDKTNAFLMVNLDDVPPVLMPDKDRFDTDGEGNYTITGLTEPGATVNGVKVGEDGRFEITGSDAYRVAVVAERILIYNEVKREEKHLEDIEDFNTYKEYYGYTIEPAEWSGEGDYIITHTVPEVGEEPYTEEAYQNLLEQEKNGEIVNLQTDYGITEMSVEEAEALGESDNRAIRIEDRLKSGITEVVLTAEDEAGNTTETTVKVYSHMHQLQKVEGVPATCASEGTKAYYVCTECGEKFLDKEKTIPAGDLTIPADPSLHTYGAWKTVTKATVFKTGKKQRTCSGCGKVQSKTIAKLTPSLSLAVGTIKVSGTTIPMQTGQVFKKVAAKMKSGDILKSAASGNKSIVKVSLSTDKKKLVLTAGKKTGTAAITVTTKAGAKSTFKVKVQSGKVVATSIVGFEKTLKLDKGKTYQLPKVIKPVTVTDKMTFKSSNTKIATVTKDGLIKAVKKGTATITVTIGKKTFKCALTVVLPANSITKVTSSKTLKYSTLKTKDLSFTIAATVKDNAKKSFVLSSVPSAAKNYITVSSAGKVTVKKGLKKGTYSIKVKITAAATSKYRKTTVTKTIKIIVK